MTDVTNGNGHSETTSAQEAMEFRTATADLLQRLQFARAAGLTFDGARDLQAVLGYKDLLSSGDYYRRYLRGGIAGRIVDAPCNATWRGTVEVLEDRDPHKNTKFEEAWKSIDARLQVQSKLWRADKLSQLSDYSVLLIGTKDPHLDQEIPKGTGPDDIIYLSAYGGAGGPTNRRRMKNNTVVDDADITILEYDIDTTSERFGLPKFYQLRRSDVGVAGDQSIVHHSRCIHIADGCLFDDVFGLPALERVWNLLDDLDKVTGGGAEAFWLRANQGLHIDIDKEMSVVNAELEREALKQQAEAYKHQLTRWLKTRGVNVQTLGSDVANFAAPADAILTQISGAKAIPKRILTGSEMGELASSQDRDNWKDQVNGRQTQYAGPYIVRRFVDRLIKYSYLPPPVKDVMAYEVVWPHIEVMTEGEKAQGAAQWATVNNTQGTPVFTDAEIRDHWYKKDPLKPEEIQEQMELKKAAAAAPPPVEPPVSEELLAAQGHDSAITLSEDERELLHVLELAMDCGNYGVIEKILGQAFVS